MPWQTAHICGPFECWGWEVVFMSRFCTEVSVRKGNVCECLFPKTLSQRNRRLSIGAHFLVLFRHRISPTEVGFVSNNSLLWCKIAMAIGVLNPELLGFCESGALGLLAPRSPRAPWVLSPLVSVENYCRLDLLPFCFSCCSFLCPYCEETTICTAYMHVSMQGPAINGQKLLFTSGESSQQSPPLSSTASFVLK